MGTKQVGETIKRPCGRGWEGGGDASKAEFKEKAVDFGDFFFYLERKE